MQAEKVPGRADRSEVRRLYELQAEVLRALAQPTRIEILELLREGERCVCEFEPLLGLRQPNISQHLAILRGAGLTVARREGLRVMYRIADPAILEILQQVREIIRRQGMGIAEAVSRTEDGQ
ncbi:MAG: metalloregulator ArsR/SmtB family transcription factor [Anaerolineae bacterium]|nr:metalloregulator ArsR/SmtB family transcription factor [Anaerolineae bacterium]